MAAESVDALRLLVDLRHLRRADRDADPRNASAAADQQLRRDRSWRSSGRCRTSSARYGLRSVGAALLQRGRRRSRRRDRRGSLAGDPPDSARDRGGARRAAAAGVRRRLSDAGRHLPARLHPRHRSGRRARQGARGARRDGPLRRLQSRHRPAALGAGGHRHRRAGHRPHGAVDAGARAGPAIRPCSTPRRRRRRPSCTGRRASPTSTRSSERPGTGTARIRTAIGSDRLIRERTSTRSAACSATRRRIAARLAWAVVGDARLRRRHRPASPALIKPIFDRRPAEPASGSTLVAWAHRRRCTC